MRVRINSFSCVLYYFNGDRKDPGRGRVSFCIVGTLAAKTDVNFAMCIQARVFGPQHGDFLADGTKGIVHCSRLNGSVAGRGAAIPDPSCEDL